MRPRGPPGPTFGSVLATCRLKYARHEPRKLRSGSPRTFDLRQVARSFLPGAGLPEARYLPIPDIGEADGISLRQLCGPQQVLPLRSRLHDAHLIGCVAARQLERLLCRSRQPRLEFIRVRHQHRHALVVDALVS